MKHFLRGKSPRPARFHFLTLPAILFAILICALFIVIQTSVSAQAPISPLPGQSAVVPSPDHVIVVMEENHAYDQIIGNSQAPYINGLASAGALFTNSHAIEHPSQPNYLDLFSGSNQGITDDSCPHTFTNVANLGAELISASLTFTGYSEGLPSPGSPVCNSGQYYRKHNPWVNFTNVPAASNLPFTSYPSDYSLLPKLGFVIPNQDHDMHDGTIAQGDTWLQQNLDGYKQWAMTHNSLLIVTWDEDDNGPNNQIATIFVGPMVITGHYAENITHYVVLRTLEDMYSLPYAGQSGQVQPITDVWVGGTATPTSVPTATRTATRTSTRTATRTATPVSTSTSTRTATPTNTATSSPTPTDVLPTETGTPPSPTDTVEPTSTATQGIEPSETPTASATIVEDTPTPTVCDVTFSDVPEGSTFYPFIHCLVCLGIIDGYSDGTFRPNNEVTRGQLAKIVSNSAGFEDTATSQLFEDVPSGSTFYDYVYSLASRSIIGGYPCGGAGEPCGADNLPYYRPSAQASRGQISKIVANAAGLNDDPGSPLFADVAASSTFYDFIQRLALHGAMSGYPCGDPDEPCGPDNLPYFRPSHNATRGQLAKIVSNTFFPDCNAVEAR